MRNLMIVAGLLLSLTAWSQSKVIETKNVRIEISKPAAAPVKPAPAPVKEKVLKMTLEIFMGSIQRVANGHSLDIRGREIFSNSYRSHKNKVNFYLDGESKAMSRAYDALNVRLSAKEESMISECYKYALEGMKGQQLVRVKARFWVKESQFKKILNSKITSLGNSGFDNFGCELLN
jgi:hypothetical protein